MHQHAQQEPSFGLDASVFMEVIDSGDAGQRISLALQLAAFLANVSVPREERDQAVPAVLKLAMDPDFEVRHALAYELTTHPRLDADVLFSIVADDDEIALPFLSFTPALGERHMLAILRVGDDARRATIAMRPDVTPDAVDYIVDSLPLTVNALLLENPHAGLTPDQYQRLYSRFGDAPEIMECLLGHPGLPPDIRIAQARSTAARTRQLLLQRGWVPANDALEIVADAEEGAILQILTGASAEDLPGVVSYLLGGDMLTPSIIVRAACLGATGVLAETMAQLAGVPVARAREMMFGNSGSGLGSLLGKAGLPQSCYWTLQAACDVAREEREDGLALTSDDFGHRMIEVLMTRYEALPDAERPNQLDFMGRFAADRARLIARRLRQDMLRPAA